MDSLEAIKATIEMRRAQAKSTTPTPPRAEFSKAALHPAYVEHVRRCQSQERNNAPDPIRELLTRMTTQVGSRYRDCTLENFVTTTETQTRVLDAIKAYAADMAARIRDGQGIVLFGPSGTGKDHLLVGLMRILIERERRAAYWLNGVSLFSMFRDAMDGHDSEERLVRKLAGPHVLVLSDPQPAMGSLTAFQSQVLFQVVDERYRSQRPTWVSMNAASGDEAAAKIGMATVDRLRDGALTLMCNWPSYRKAAN